jgi:ABC-type cobalamin/Fe3+-siderophores transport system ATPase subunit
LLKTIANLLPCKGRKIAILSQILGIYFSYSVFDAVMMGRYLHIKDKFLGLPSEETERLRHAAKRAKWLAAGFWRRCMRLMLRGI